VVAGFFQPRFEIIKSLPESLSLSLSLIRHRLCSLNALSERITTSCSSPNQRQPQKNCPHWIPPPP